MNQQEWFKLVEQEKPGLLRKIWDDYLCSCTQETNGLIARDLTIHARLRGDQVIITRDGWRHYRATHDLVSKHRRKSIVDAPSPQVIDPIPEPEATVRLTNSRQAIAALEAVIDFLKDFEGFGITERTEPHGSMGQAIETLFGQNGMFSEKELSEDR